MSQKPSEDLSGRKWPADRRERFDDRRSGPPVRNPLAAQPRVDIAACDAELIVTAEVPGLQISDLDISVTNDVMTLHAHESLDSDGTSTGSHIGGSHRILHGSFVRHIRLPCAVNAENASASYHNGTLRVLFPNAIHDRDGEAARDAQDNVLTVYFGVGR